MTEISAELTGEGTPAEVFFYRMDLSYVGTKYHGWQSQPSGRGIQDEVERALGIIVRHKIRIQSASRTDTGVHAEQQVCTFKTAFPFNEYKWKQGLNGLMDESIRVKSIHLASTDFHPIISSNGKAYRYRIIKSDVDSPFFQPFCWRVYGPLNVDLIVSEAASFVGEHDFTSFCASDSNAKSKVRKVLEIKVADRGPLIDIWVVGEGFLKQMVRNIVGTLVAVGAGRIPPGSVPKIFAAKDRRAAPKTAPAQGLTLVKIFYDRLQSADSLIFEASQGFTQSI